MRNTKRPARILYQVRLYPDAGEHLEQLAGEETEGNISQMIRKLLSEALAARTKRTR